MAKINKTNIYTFDELPSLMDFLIGSDEENSRKTRSYRINVILQLLNGVNGQNNIQFLFSDGSIPDFDYASTGAMFTNNNATNPTAFTKLIFNKSSLFPTDLTPLFTALGTMQNLVLTIKNPQNPNIFFNFRVTAFDNETDFFIFDVVPYSNFYAGQLQSGTIYSLYFDVKEAVNQNNIFLSKKAVIPTLYINETMVVSTINALTIYAVTEINNVIYNLLHRNALGVISVYKYILINKGKGNYGSGGIQVTIGDLELVYVGPVTLAEITALADTQTIALGNIGISTVEAYVNTHGPYLIQDQDDGYTIVTATIDGQDLSYLFIGTGGLYGVGEDQTTSADFQPLNAGNLTVGNQNIQQVLGNGNVYGANIPGLVCKMIFDGDIGDPYFTGTEFSYDNFGSISKFLLMAGVVQIQTKRLSSAPEDDTAYEEDNILQADRTFYTLASVKNVAGIETFGLVQIVVAPAALSEAGINVQWTFPQKTISGEYLVASMDDIDAAAQNLDGTLGNGNEAFDKQAVFRSTPFGDVSIGDGGVYIESEDGTKLLRLESTGTNLLVIEYLEGPLTQRVNFAALAADHVFTIPNETGIAATKGHVQDVVDQLINGAPSDSNTLKELNDKIVAINAIIGDAAPDGDALVNKVVEILAIFSTYTEGADILTALSGKVNISDVVNILTQAVPGKILDARQGKVLKDLIDALTTVVSGKAASVHSHAISDITLLQAVLDSRVKVIASKSEYSTPHTGDTTETILEAIEITTADLASGFRYFMNFGVGKTGGLGILTPRIKINTSNTLAGAVQVAITSTTAGALTSALKRDFNIKASGHLEGFPFTQQANDDTQSVVGARSTTPVSTAASIWVFLTGTLGNSGDSCFCTGYSITKFKQ